jgi:hypothetical protein
MRRGLMRWDAEELPTAVLADRIARLRAMMQRQRIDAFLAYTNLVRPSAVNWLTGFTPYWSEGALLLLAEGSPLFATALSKRVSGWIQSTNPLSEILNAPRPGLALGARLVSAGAKRVGVLELDALPTALYDDLLAAAPDTSFADASAAFAEVRRRIDDTERALLARADAIACEALSRTDAALADASAIAGEVEKRARLAGAEEAYIAIAPDLDADPRLQRVSKPAPLGERFAVRASIAYKGCWVRRMRTFTPAQIPAVIEAESWLNNVAKAIEPGKPLAAQLATSVRLVAGAELQNWMAESCVGTYPLQVIAAGGDATWSPAPGEFLVLTAALSIDSRPWLGAAPLMLR